MPGLKIYNSNRLELLSEQLAGLLARNPLPPLTAEIIVVQNPGMGRWLSLRLAAALGIWANFDFSLPDRFLWKIFRMLYPDLPDQTIYDKEILTWRLMDLLPGPAGHPLFSAVNSYLAGGSKISRYQLAEKLAGLYNKYMLFRPEMLNDWDRKTLPGHTRKPLDDEAWQRQLWQSLNAGANEQSRPHRARLLANSLAMLNEARFDPGVLPPRLSFFAISSLPPLHISLLNGLARHLEVNFFIINPCREYWGDIVSEQDKSRIGRNSESSGADLHLDTGNSLLASMGRLGRDFLNTLQEFDSLDYEFFLEPEDTGLLSSIQSDILHLRDQGPAAGILSSGRVVADHDLSVQIHSCHSPMRELEVLRDQLLSLFDRQGQDGADGRLLPSDILVMVPDIEAYGPLIEAVFSATPAGSPSIPFSIADWSIIRRSELLKTFFAVLDLADGRYAASRVLAVLESPAIHKKFGIAADDLEIISRWVEGSNIRWGMDRENRRRLGLPPFAENTWQAGIERLLLGYAMAGHNEKIFAGILPYDQMEGAATEILGRFLDFIETLFRHLRIMEQPWTLQGWSEKLAAFLQDCFQPLEETAHELRLLRGQILKLAEIQTAAGFNDRVEIGIIHSFLSKSIEQETRAGSAGRHGFLTGGVTFCAMLPMRSIPFQVICLLGMNDRAFPRTDPVLSFDLMAADPRPGDRSQRLDDRYLFLESILAARRQLYLSYVGQSIKDDSRQPPSVLVSELLDYIESSCRTAEHSGRNILEHILVRHRLQPFNPDYFQAGDEARRLFSYDHDNYRAALALTAEKTAPTCLLAQPLAVPSPDFRQVEIDRLLSFFSQPVKFLMNNRLGIYLERYPDGSPEHLDREPMQMQGLARYRLETELLDLQLAGKDLAAYREIKKAAGELPPGRVGAFAYHDLQADIEELSRDLQKLIGAQPLLTREIDLTLGDFHLAGRLTGLSRDGLLRFRCAKIKARDQISAWIQHLLLNTLAEEPAGPGKKSLLVGKDKMYCCKPVPAAGEILEELLGMYWEGLSQPLPFFPEASFACADRLLNKKGTEDEAVLSAGQVWHGSESGRQRGEAEDPYYRLCYKNINPLQGPAADRFLALAVRFFKPLFAYMEEA